MAIKDNAKLALRLAGEDFDAEIEMLIHAAQSDMTASGVPEDVAEDASNDWAVLAICIYCKMHFGSTPDEAAKYQPIYDAAVAKLADAKAAEASQDAEVMG